MNTYADVIEAADNPVPDTGNRGPRTGNRVQAFRVIRSALGLALGALAAAGCGGVEPAADPVTQRVPVAVAVTTVTSTPRAAVIEAGGLVQAKTTAVVTSRLMAPVRDVRVRPGDVVQAGHVLVVLDDRDIGAQARSASAAAAAAGQSVSAAGADREAAVAALALAKASHGRVATLHGRKSATPQELDESTAALRAAEARLAAIDARVQQTQASLAAARAGSDAAAVTASFAVVAAPFAGVVTETLVEPGNMAMPGTPLVRLEARGALRLDVRVDAARVTDVAVGQALDVAFDAAPSLRLHGTVSEVARAMDADARTYLVKIALPAEPRLRSGMFGRVRFPGPSSPVLLVTATALSRRGQVTSLFVVDGEMARLRMVVLGRTFPEGVEVVSGLSDGERIVTAPPIGLSDGTSIRAGAK